MSRLWVALANEAVKLGALQKPAELAPLLEQIAAERPRVVVEIGTCRGGTLWAMCQVAAADAQVVSVDLPGGGSSGGQGAPVETLTRLLLRTQRGTFIRGDSHAPAIRTAAVAALEGPVDLLMIDGDHTYAGVRQDFEEYGPLVRAGGLVVFHDILPHPRVPACQVDRLWREVRDAYPHDEYCQPDHDAGWGQWGGIGVLRWTTPRPGVLSGAD